MSAAPGLSRRRATLAISRITARESFRARLPFAWLVVVALLLGAQWFLEALALIDAGDVATSITAPVARLLAVLVTMVFTVAPISREMAERGTDIMFSAPLPRACWVAGRMLGHSVLAVATALFAALVLLIQAPDVASFLWAVTLAFECILVAGFSVLITISLVRLPLSLLAVLATYACARLIGVIQMINQTHSETSLYDWILDVLSLLLPRLDLNAQTQWLIQGPPESLHFGVGASFMQTAIYVTILLVAACLDIERRRD